MNLCLYEAQSDSLAIWGDLTQQCNLKLTVYTSWSGIDSIPADANLIVLDKMLVPISPLENVENVIQARPSAIIVVTGNDLSVSQAVRLMNIGVACCFEKPINVQFAAEQLPRLIARSSAVAAEKQEFQRLEQLFSSLTHRERDVLELIVDGVSNRETADKLDVSVRTVESRRSKVYSKLHSQNLADLVRVLDRYADLQRRFSASSKI